MIGVRPPKKSIWLVIKMSFLLLSVHGLNLSSIFFLISTLSHIYILNFGTPVTNPEPQQVCSYTPLSCPFYFYFYFKSAALVNSDQEADLIP